MTKMTPAHVQDWALQLDINCIQILQVKAIMASLFRVFARVTLAITSRLFPIDRSYVRLLQCGSRLLQFQVYYHCKVPQTCGDDEPLLRRMHGLWMTWLETDRRMRTCEGRYMRSAMAKVQSIDLSPKPSTIGPTFGTAEYKIIVGACTWTICSWKHQ